MSIRTRDPTLSRKKVRFFGLPEIRDIGAKERLATLNLVHPEVVRARVQGLELAALARRPGHAAILGARVEWLPHQIDVATRAMRLDALRRSEYWRDAVIQDATTQSNLGGLRGGAVALQAAPSGRPFTKTLVDAPS